MTGDRIDMDTDGVATTMNGVASTGGAFRSGWSAATATGTGGLGQGPLGAAFLAGFTPGAQRLTDDAAAIARHIGQVADAGHSAVAGYRAADGAGADAFGATSGDR